MGFTKKSFTLVLGAVSVLSLALAGCDGQTTATAPPAGGSAAASVWFLSGMPKEGMFKTDFDAWNAANPDKKIAYEVYANDAYKEKIRTSIGAGQAPTLVWNWGAFGVVAEYVEAGQIISLDGKVDAALSRIIPSVADAGKLDGVQYAVPNGDVQPVMLFYNKDLFERAGVSAPIKTWDELLVAVEKFKEIDVAPFALAAGSKWPDLMWLEYLADRVGGPDTFNDVVAGKAGAWSSPEMIKALTYIQDLVQADAFQPGFTSTTADAHADVALVYSGKAAMLLQGSWAYGSFKADAPDFVSSGKLDSFPFPTVAGGKGDPGNIAGNPSNFFSISASASPTAQQTALEWLNSDNLSDSMVTSLVNGGGIPPVPNAQSKLEASADAEFLLDGYNLVLNAPHFQASWDQVLPSATAQQMLTNLDKLFQGQITPQEFATDMDKTIGK